MGIAVLGPLAVDGTTGQLRHHDRVVLAALATRPREPLSADLLADAIWGDEPPETWTKVVQGCVVRLRKVLGPDAIETTPQGYRLTLDADEVDSLRFEHLVDRGRELLALAEPDRAAFVLDEAVGLWRGQPLAELDGWEGGRAETARLEELRLSAEELGVDAALRSGRCHEVVGRARQLVDLAPLRERRWALLALAHYQCGAQAEALQVLRDLRSTLADELGIDPGPDIVELERAILRQDPVLTAPEGGVDPSPVCPYRGLLPYGVHDGEAFFGREQELTTCLAHLEEYGVLTVVGASGSGKSSLVRAGVAAALTRKGRRVRIVSPGPHPLDIIDGLPRTGAPPVLVVDQCEEAVTLCDSTAEQAEFFERLAAHAEESPLVLALRADQVGAMATHPAFAQLLQRGFQLLRPMGPEGLRACIVRPAEQAGLLVEPGLVELLLRDLEDEPGALPLLSHALRETWTNRQGRTLTVAGYHASGGIRGAVARTADEVHDELPPDERPLLRDLMLRLVTSSPGGQLVRARVSRHLLLGTDDDPRASIVERLVSARLLVVDRDRVEIAHEALIRAWPRLRQWLDDDAVGRRVREHLTASAAAWEDLGRPDSELYRGVRLGQVLEWHANSGADLTPVEQEFVGASRALVEAELEEARRHAKQEREARRRTRRLAVGLAAALALALVAAAAATVFQQSATDRADEAAAASTEADANRLAALSSSVRAIDLSMLLAVAAFRTADTPATRDGLLNAVLDHGRASQVLRLGHRPVAATLADDGRVLYAVTNSQILTWKVGSPEPPRVIKRWGNMADVVAGAPSEDLVAVWQWRDDRTPVVGVFDSSGRERFRLEGLDQTGGIPMAVGFSTDNRRLFVAVLDRPSGRQQMWLREYAISTGELVGERRVQRQPTPGGWIAASFSSDGSRSVSWLMNDPASAVLVENRTTRRTPLDVESRSTAPARHTALPDGAALTWSDGAIGLYDASGAPTQLLEAHSREVDDIVLAPDGSWAASGDSSGQVVVWDVDAGSGAWSPREALSGPEGHVLLAAGPDSTLVSVSGDGTVVVWDLSDDAGLAGSVPGLGSRGWVSNTPAEVVPGELVVAPTRQGDGPWWEHARVSATFLDPRTGAVVDQVYVGDKANSLFGSSVSVSPDRTLVAVTHQLGTVVLDARTREEVARITLDEVEAFAQLMPENVWCSAWTPDGSRLLLCAEGEEFDATDGNLVVVDTETWQVQDERVDVGGTGQAMELSPDGSLLAVGMALPIVDEAPPATVKILDARSLEVVREIELGTDLFPFDVSFSPDGRRLAIGVDTGLVFVADVETGELSGEPAHLHSSFVGQVEWLPDNRTVVSTGNDTHLVLYDADRGLRRARMPVAVDGSDEGQTYLLRAGLDEVSALTRQRPGRTYSLDPAEWRARACAVAGRDLSRDEWSRYLPDREYEPTCVRGAGR